jgi:acetylglutamate/LysW-gamma-L-alpha-aminoadipate kinase
MCGLDGGLIRAERKKAIVSIENGKRRVIRDDFSGKIRGVNTALLEMLLDQEYLPVVAPLALGEEGEALNVDADRAAAEVAGALKAECLVLLTAVPGLMRDFPDESSLIQKLSPEQLEDALKVAQGRMKKKVLGAREALQQGAAQVIIADGRQEQPISAALAGSGTWIG